MKIEPDKDHALGHLGHVAHVKRPEKEESLPRKCVEDFLKMGRYCILILLVSEFILLLASGNMIFMVFAGSAPHVSCRGLNYTIEDVCREHPDVSNLTDCELDVKYEFESLNVEYGYLCARGQIVKSSISVQMIGVLIGTLFFGTMSDRYGRKLMLVITYVTTALFSIATSFSDSLLVFTVLRTILGFFSGGLLGTYGVYKMEHIPKEHRFWVATVIAWAPNYILLNGIAYLSQDWRTLQRALVFVTIPAAPLLYIVSESPRWLVQTGKTDEALRVLRRIQHIDGEKKEKREEMENTINAINSQLLNRKKPAKSYNVRHLFYTRQMTLATIVLCVGVFFTSVINYGLVFNIDALHGSFFINSVLMGSIRWLINILFAVLDYKVKAVGRKTVHFISQASIAASLAIISVIYILGLETVYPSVIRVLALYAAATVAQIYITKNISTVEFYPTVIRNSAIAFKSMWARLGTVCAPQLFVLTFWAPLPWVVIAILATLDTTFFQIVIPETKGKPMPESLPKKRHKIKQHHTSYFDRIDKL